MIYIGLGANLPGKFGEPAETVYYAIRRLNEEGIAIENQSSFYRTSPVPRSDQPDFINVVVAADCKMKPEKILQVLHKIEEECGRIRTKTNEARMLDLDLLDYHGQVCSDPALPHPRMEQRLFVLNPLQEIAPDWIHPVTKQPVDELIQKYNSSDQRIEKLSVSA